MLTNGGTVVTNPQVVTLAANTTYIVEFKYRMIAPGSGGNALYCWFQPAGTTDSTLWSFANPLLNNASATGTFSTGLLTGHAASYVLSLRASGGASIVIDDIVFYRQDAIQTTSTPAAWDNLQSLPFPRLGYNFNGAIIWAAQPSSGGAPSPYSVEQVEYRLAFGDVLTAVDNSGLSLEPANVRRLRQLNPNLVILPYRIAQEQEMEPNPAGIIDIDNVFQQGIADGWYVRDTEGNYVYEAAWPGSRPMNISPFCPVVNGATFMTSLEGWLLNPVFPTGMWDGVLFDNLFGRINPYVPGASNPALLDYDWNRNGLRDETPASSSDMTRQAGTQFLSDLRNAVGGSQIIVGNAGPFPELAFAPYVNGYLFEAWNTAWDYSFLPEKVSGGWRKAFDDYRYMQAHTAAPQTLLLTGTGISSAAPGAVYVTPTADDIQTNRFVLGSALLEDGFYGYYGPEGANSPAVPFWFDEFSVDANGVAVDDPADKGYLGQALSDATELATPGTLVYQQDFESGSLPSSLLPNAASGVLVSRSPNDVIGGSYGLVLDNPDHTTQGFVGVQTSSTAVPLIAGNTYLLTFDWRIVETLDGAFNVYVVDNSQSPSPNLEFYQTGGVVAGDSGSAQVSFTVTSSGNWSILFFMIDGGGRVAIDNIRLYNGGVGPWRRDFENGFVLVNPYNRSQTFSASDLAGGLRRAGIRRILGTQAPGVNNGQAVTGDLTLGPFDAIILLADHVPARVHPVRRPVGPGRGLGKRAVSLPTGTGSSRSQPSPRALVYRSAARAVRPVSRILVGCTPIRKLATDCQRVRACELESPKPSGSTRRLSPASTLDACDHLRNATRMRPLSQV
jgi:hypothetical protein